VLQFDDGEEIDGTLNYFHSKTRRREREREREEEKKEKYL